VTKSFSFLQRTGARGLAKIGSAPENSCKGVGVFDLRMFLDTIIANRIWCTLYEKGMNQLWVRLTLTVSVREIECPLGNLIVHRPSAFPCFHVEHMGTERRTRHPRQGLLQ